MGWADTAQARILTRNSVHVSNPHARPDRRRMRSSRWGLLFFWGWRFATVFSRRGRGKVSALSEAAIGFRFQSRVLRCGARFQPVAAQAPSRARAGKMPGYALLALYSKMKQRHQRMAGLFFAGCGLLRRFRSLEYKGPGWVRLPADSTSVQLRLSRWAEEHLTGPFRA